MPDFWSAQLGATTQQLPAAEVRADGEAYRQHMSQSSGSLVYTEQYQQARMGSVLPRSIYEPAAPRTLADYAKPTASKWARGNESDAGYLAKLRGAGLDKDDNWGVLASEDQAVITAELEKIQGAEGKSVEAAFQAQREINDARSSSLAGHQKQGTRVDQSMRFGHSREIAKGGHMAAAASNLAGVPLASMSDVAAGRRAADEQFIPQRSDETASAMRGQRTGQIPGRRCE